MRFRPPLSVVSIALVLAGALAGPTAAAGKSLPGTPVPKGFVGVNLDGPPLVPQDGVPLPPQLDQMQSNGVESVRTTFNWADAQPYASWADVPAIQASRFQTGAGGVPTDFAETDYLVQLAAERGLTLMPIVLFTPGWDAGQRVAKSLAQPRSDQPYADYLTTLVDRYGPRGSFWRLLPGIPKRPIRMWEVWNEPWLTYYWPTQPFQRSYVALLSAAHAAVKRADSGAKVVLAGVPNASWRALSSIYAVRGARGQFDVVDVHPYTKYPKGVITILSLVRARMNRAGDSRKPMIAGETGWTSSLHQTPHMFTWETTPTGQARNVRRLLPLLAANRRRLRLLAFFWYTWMGDQYRNASPWNFSGLVGFHDGRVFTKPALFAFRYEALKLEHRRG